MLYFTAYLGKVHAIPVTHKIKQSAFLVASDLHWTIRPPQERENPVETVDDCLESIEVGTFVAVNLSNCDKVPVIGKVLEVDAEKVKMHYWKGSFKGKWCPQNVPRSQTPWVDELPKSMYYLVLIHSN